MGENFFDDPLVGWTDMQGAFANDLGALETPHRWINADNENLGRWRSYADQYERLFDLRSAFLHGRAMTAISTELMVQRPRAQIRSRTGSAGQG